MKPKINEILPVKTIKKWYFNLKALEIKVARKENPSYVNKNAKLG